MATKLRNAKQTVQSISRDGQSYFVALVTAAIAISYFDRQTLPVAISSIQRAIPLNDREFTWLQFAFLIPYAVLYAAGGRMLDTVNFLLKLMPKDLLYAQNEASQCNVDLKTAEVARSLFETAIDRGLGDKDMASVIESLRNK